MEIIDLEAHGGLYTLHSHMNHNCNPNVSVRHIDQRTALSRITVIAKRDIAVGEDLGSATVSGALRRWKERVVKVRVGARQ